MRTLVNTPAFGFDELQFDWGDVVLAAIGWGEWQALERSLAEGLAWVASAEARGEQVDDETVSASVVTFRRARGLLAGDDYLRWMAERSLSAADVRAHFVRAAMRGRAVDRTGSAVHMHRPEPGLLADAIRGEAILSGRLRSWAERVAQCAAAARGLMAAGEEPPTASGDAIAALLGAAAACRASGLGEVQIRDRAPRLAALQLAAGAFVETVVTREQIERCLSEHRLDWQRFVWEEVTFAAEGAAREAALLVREDGMPLADVAGLAHATANIREAYADDVSELSSLLAAAAPGELVGPLAGDGAGAGGWRLVRMRERTLPTVDDDVLRERASAELVDQALARHLAGRVTWHGKY